MFKAFTPALLLAALLLAAPMFAQQANQQDTCVTDYDPSVDYFPDKAEITDAQNFTVQYFNNYKVVTVTDAFEGADPFTYVLIQCGTPPPANATFPDTAQFLEVPAGEIIAMSTTQLPHLASLGLLDQLVGLDTAAYVSSPEVRERFEAGQIVEIGSGGQVNVELALETDPDIIMTFGFNPSTDAHPALIEAGIFTALNAEWRENTPLARAEWVKYVGLFYNAEAEATAVYEDIVTAYDETRELAASVPEDERPVVLWNSVSAFSPDWLVPGAETYAGALIEDAGGRIAMGELAPTDSAQVGFETVYDQALDVDVWVVNAFGLRTIDDLLAVDPRYADFAALQAGNVWNDNLDENENGGNNYYELGVTNPHLILEDLVALFHPELLPDHTFNFYRPLDPTDG